jgi:hydrogenase maturation factor
MDELKALESLATALGVHTHYTDGLGQPVSVAPETLLRVCAALGADPWGALASGSVLAAFPPERSDVALRELGSRGHAAALIAHAGEGAGLRLPDGSRLRRFDRDEVTRVLADDD